MAISCGLPDGCAYLERRVMIEVDGIGLIHLRDDDPDLAFIRRG